MVRLLANQALRKKSAFDEMWSLIGRAWEWSATLSGGQFIPNPVPTGYIGTVFRFTFVLISPGGGLRWPIEDVSSAELQLSVAGTFQPRYGRLPLCQFRSFGKATFEIVQVHHYPPPDANFGQFLSDYKFAHAGVGNHEVVCRFRGCKEAARCSKMPCAQDTVDRFLTALLDQLGKAKSSVNGGIACCGLGLAAVGIGWKIHVLFLGYELGTSSGTLAENVPPTYRHPGFWAILTNGREFFCISFWSELWCTKVSPRSMEERQKLKLTDRSGKPFPEEHLAVLDDMQEALWMPYSRVRDDADRAKVMGDTLDRVQRWEQNQNRPIDDLPSAIRLSFRRAVLNFLREAYYRFEPEVLERSKWEAVPQDTEPDSLVQILMKEFLKSLSIKEKQVVSLTAQKLKAKDVAKKLGISEANVYQINHRVRERFKDIF